MSGIFKGFVISGLGGGGEDGAEDTSQARSTVRAADKPISSVYFFSSWDGKDVLFVYQRFGLFLRLAREIC
jgi:hypothetical protein